MITTYLLIYGDGQAESYTSNDVGVYGSFWEVQGSSAALLWTNGYSIDDPNTEVEVSDSDLLSALTRTAHGMRRPDKVPQLVQLQTNVGEYFPRVARPVFSRLGFERQRPPHDEHAFRASERQLESLVTSLQRIFRTVEPDPENLGAYGHEVRNLLILACTEVEAQLKGILEANHCPPGGHRFTTADYVKLLPVMKLDAYSLRLPMYPHLGEVAPFRGWEPSRPTQSLDWYDAYNAVKHDREGAFHRAQISHTIDALAACAILLISQYRVFTASVGFLGTFFLTTNAPKWGLQETYMSASRDEQWRPANLSI